MDNKKFEEILKEANVLLMNKNSLLYFGILSYGLNKYLMSEEDSKEIFKTPVLNEKGEMEMQSVPILGFVTNMIEGITYVTRDDITSNMLVSITIHELIHLISNHLYRQGTRNNTLWNISIDHVVNRSIKAMSEKFNYVKWDDRWVLFEDIHKQYPEITPEDLYDMLMKGAKKIDSHTQMGKDGKKIIVVQDDNKKMYASGDNKDGSDPEQSEKKAKDFINKAKTIWNSPSVKKGNMPSDIVSYLDNIFEVEIPWHEVLEEAVLYESQTCENASWTRKNPYIRIATLPDSIDGESPMIFIGVIDTSASITDDDLRRFMGVILGSVKYFKSLIILMHDTDISETLIFDREPTIGEVLDKISNIKGRGGTSHKDVFNYIERVHGEEMISTVIFFTDFYSDVENIYNKYTWIKEIKPIWVVNRKPFNVVLPGIDSKTINLV